MKEKNNQQKVFARIILVLIFCCVTLLLTSKVLATTTEEENQQYLSDLDYITTNNWSFVGWGSIKKDMPPEGSQITLKINGQNQKFFKGMGIHANAQLTYDISALSSKYTKFITKAGVDASRGSNGDGVIFIMQVSNNGSEWTELYKSSAVKGNSEALDIEINIQGYKYLRIIANQNRNKDSDHAVLADARLVKEGYTEDTTTVDFIKTVDEYDTILKEYGEDEQQTDEYEKVLLQRELVKNAEYDTLQFLARYKNSYKETLKWLMDDLENLRLYVLGGYPDGRNYMKSITILSDLRTKYGEDFTIQEKTKYETTTLGNLYKKMAVALSLTHSSNVALWMQPGATENQSDPVKRYQIYKDMYNNGNMRFTDTIDFAKWFERYTTEEMRYVMNCGIDDDEILWLNEYTQSFIDANSNKMWYLSPHPYMKYIWPNYNKPQYWDEANKDAYDKKYKGIFSKYGVEFGKPGVYKLWMNIEGGAVCGGISKQGACNRGAHGVPATVVSQPGHAAFAYYTMNEQTGDGYWTLNNVITNWGQTGKTEKLSVRMPLGWGSDSYVSGWAASYLLLGQAAMNQEEAYEESEKIIMTADIYKDNPVKQEEIYRKALEKLSINIDAWYGLINCYNANGAKTEEDWYHLADEMAEALKCYPLPMYNLTNLIKTKLTSSEYMAQFVILQKRILEYGKVLPNTSTETYQPSVTREVSAFLLGQMDTTIATFSFNGDDAGKIVLASRFDEMGIRWEYCINGDTQNKESWKEVSFEAINTNTEGEELQEHKWKLTPEELASLTAENDIYVHLVGVNYDEKNLFKIDILDPLAFPSTLYANDQENKLIAAVPEMEWKLNETDNWTLYQDAEPDLTGNKTISVRMSATGTHLAGEEMQYTFHQDEINDKRKYIPIANLEIAGYSTQSNDSNRPYYAPNAIDGNVNTLWHTDFAQNVLQQKVKPFISIKLNELKNISAVEFTQRKYPNRPQDPDNIRNARVYVSMDGETWIQAGAIETCETYGELYAINFEKPVYGQYVKIEMDTTSMFASLALVNLYEDITVTTLATFSFDGEKAGKIVLTDEFKDTNWQYSLDGKVTWKNGNGNEHQLTAEELESINEENNIEIRLTTANKSSTIEIQKQDPPVISAYLNDLENRLIGIENTANLEWAVELSTKTAESKTWTSYDEQEPIVLGDAKLFIRKKANSVLVASEPVEFVFTQDNQPDTAKYIPIKHLSIESCSTQSPDRGEAVENAIDGNINTIWHTDHVTPDTKRTITIKLDEPRYVSKLQYVKKSGYLYGVMKNGIISTSMDGENWEVVATIENLYNPTNSTELRNSENTKDIIFEKVNKAQYIKLQCTKSCDYVNGSSNGIPYDYFIAAAMLNLFEDTTKVEVPTAQIEYNITEATNQEVEARLVNPSTEITITNNNGNDTYTFTQNGEFTFEFVDRKGTKGTAKAKVDWICKTLPTASITYSTTDLTNQDVTASITFDRDNVKILNDEGEIIETIKTGNAYTYTFTQNGTHEIRFRGPYGNEGRTVIAVDWINKTAPVATIKYSSTNVSNQDVTASITFDRDNVKILNDEGEVIETILAGNAYTYTFTENGTHEIRFRGPYGNEGRTVAEVTWIDKRLPTASIAYSTTNLTNQDVIASITFDKDNVTILNEAGDEIETILAGNAYTYTFTENGTHAFKFRGPAGNEGTAIAQVSCIDKEAPIGTIEYSTTDLTNQDVTATITFNEEVTITNNEGKNTYTFPMNGEFEFQFVDKAGNRGTAKAQVEWIDKREINATISYDINDITNQDVTATITFDKENVRVEGGNTYTFTENGRHEFKFIGPAGNTGSAIAEVTWIDKIPPVATVTYNITELTNQDVIATVTFDEGGVTMINEKGEEIENGDTHTFTENGTHTFYYRGPLGNIGTATATVTWINKNIDDDFIFKSTVYKIEDNYISMIRPGIQGENLTTVKELKENITTNQSLSILSKEGVVLEDSDTVGTGMTLKVGEKVEYTLIVRGDINGDGNITLNDLVNVKLHCIELELLTQEKLKAADITADDRITINDVAVLKLLMIGGTILK